MKKLWLVLMLALVIAGCGKNGEENKNNESQPTPVEENKTDSDNKNNNPVVNTNPKGYLFVYNNVTIGMDMEAAPIIEALGKADSYFEAPSCAFDGLDKTYSYGSFEIDTYELNGKDYISSVYFCDDLVETPEGVCLFDKKADMLKAYGDGYKEEFGMLVYEKEGMKLKFILDGEDITSIVYASTVLEVQ